MIRLSRRYIRAAKAELTARSGSLLPAGRHADSGDWEEKEKKRLLAVLTALLASMGLEKELKRIAAVARNLTLREWKLAVRRTLGVDLDSSCGSEEFCSPVTEPWLADTEKRFRQMPERLADRLLSGLAGVTAAAGVLDAIDAACLAAQAGAQSFAADCIGTLNTGLCRLQQEDAGTYSYVWITAGDDKVRESHRVLHGKEFRWDSPPEIVTVTKRGTKRRRLHPGEDYRCRCVAAPVFDRSTLKLRTAGGGRSGAV